MSGAADKPPSTLGQLLTMLPPLPAPTLEQEVRRLISLHGKDAVATEVKAQTKRKRGRKQDPDWPLLWPVIQMDAEDWLAGRDPTKRPRTNYAIAQSFAAAHPGQSANATHRRIMKKLKASRRFFFLMTAERDGELRAPFAAYMRTLESLADMDRHPVWQGMLARAHETLGKYRELNGEPSPEMTFAQVKESSQPVNWLGQLASLPTGMLGGLLPKPQSD